jgi:hypothetical protein
MPEFTGTTEDLIELFYSFLVGVTEEDQLRGLCDSLMEAFGKGEHVRLTITILR